MVYIRYNGKPLIHKQHIMNRLSKQRLKGVNRKLKKLIKRASKRSPVRFEVAWMGGKRTAKEQNELYEKGVTNCDGYKSISKHQYGKAVDVLPYVHGEVCQDDKYYYIIIGVIMATANIDIRSGGDWDKDGEFVTDQQLKDLAHTELI